MTGTHKRPSEETVEADETEPPKEEERHSTSGLLSPAPKQGRGSGRPSPAPSADAQSSVSEKPRLPKQIPIAKKGFNEGRLSRAGTKGTSNSSIFYIRLD